MVMVYLYLKLYPSQNRGELALQQLGNVRLEVQFDDEPPKAV